MLDSNFVHFFHFGIITRIFRFRLAFSLLGLARLSLEHLSILGDVYQQIDVTYLK
jgi:hypothetical protein